MRASPVSPGGLRTDCRSHVENPAGLRRLEALLLDHLPFHLSSFLCYLFGPGDRVLNLLFLAEHSRVPYLHRGWGRPAPPRSPSVDLCWLQATLPPWGLIWTEPVWGCDLEMQAPSPEPGTPPPASWIPVSRYGLSWWVFFFFPPFFEAVVIVRGTLNFLPRTILYFSTL